MVYWAMRLSLHSVTSAVLYMGYLLLLALFDFLITGEFPFSSPPVLFCLVFLPFQSPPAINGDAFHVASTFP